jgi:hypothetical protein
LSRLGTFTVGWVTGSRNRKAINVITTASSLRHDVPTLVYIAV